MKLYELDMDFKYGDGYFRLEKGKIEEYDTEDKPIFINDKDYPELVKSIGKSDILRTLTPFPLFSYRLKNILSKFEDFKFHPVSIKHDGELNNDYFLAILTKKLDCIDHEHSSITGNPFFDEIVFDFKKIPESAMAFVPSSGFNSGLYTENFIKIIKENYFDLYFSEVG